MIRIVEQHQGTGKHFHRVGEFEPVLRQICLSLGLIPGEVHRRNMHMIVCINKLRAEVVVGLIELLCRF